MGKKAKGRERQIKIEAKRNRKQRKRLLKQISAPVSSGQMVVVPRHETTGLFGKLKISDTLLRYAMPLTEWLDSDASPGEMQHLLEIAADIWNVATGKSIIARAAPSFHLRSAISALTDFFDVTQSEARDIVDKLYRRRQSEFADVKYQFGPISVEDRGGGEFYVMAGAVAPYGELHSADDADQRHT